MSLGTTDTLRSAAVCALDVLRTIRDADAENGIADPDVAEAIERLDAAIRSARKQQPVARAPKNAWGFKRGDPVRIIDGRKAGKRGVFAGVSNATDIYVEIDGKRSVIKAAYVQKAAQRSEEATA